MRKRIVVTITARKSTDAIYVTMLGNFTIAQAGAQSDNAILSELTGRSRRLWILIAYLIINRKRGVPAAELIDLLWPTADNKDPQSRLQNNISRARAALSGGALDNPKDLIRFENGLYWWAPGRQTILDVDIFEETARACSTINEENLERSLEACSLYGGDFLQQATDEPWSVNLNIYYRTLFTKHCARVLSALRETDRHEDIKHLCHRAINIDPTIEEFNVALMDALVAEGSPQKAIDHYEHIKTIFADTYGVQVPPEVEMRRNIAMEAIYGSSTTKDGVLDYFGDEDESDGAFHCSTATFREIVQLHARMLERRGECSQIVGVEFDVPKGRKAASEQAIVSAKRIEGVLQSTLRSGDPFTKMGRNLFLCLLPGANEACAEMVTRRILDNYAKEYPFAKVAFKTWTTDLRDL